jgi:hypothetical protein
MCNTIVWLLLSLQVINQILCSEAGTIREAARRAFTRNENLPTKVTTSAYASLLSYSQFNTPVYVMELICLISYCRNFSPTAQKHLVGHLSLVSVTPADPPNNALPTAQKAF